MRNSILYLIIGFLIGLLLARRESERKREFHAAKPASAPRPSRTLEEIAPLVKDEPTIGKAQSAEAFIEFEYMLADQLVQPNMTELEAEMVRQKIRAMLANMYGLESYFGIIDEKRKENLTETMQ